MLTANGLVKLVEELGELQQVVGKMLEYGSGAHPDGTESLLIRFEEEAADVEAAIKFVADTHGANRDAMFRRTTDKIGRFEQWHNDPTNMNSPHKSPNHEHNTIDSCDTCGKPRRVFGRSIEQYTIPMCTYCGAKFLTT